MASLERNLRKDLEKTVKAARRVAEAGARKAVAQLGVGEAEAPKHLSADHRALRNRLRAHGRQLGDHRDPKTGAQETERLVQECAYEHWHRMLFARFLAETDLLIEPDSGVAITIDEVQELAREKATDWLELASDYAERMLPQIFRKDDPVLQIALPPETRSEMEDLLKDLTKPVFEADDSLGWVYQFWQADKKDEVNKSEVKIGADELPAVTQLFTEDYMVLFLLHNTLGAWWAGKVLADNPSLATLAPDEAALRAACKVGDIDWTYLRFVRDTTEDRTEEPWRPAAGVFGGWPKAAKDVTVLDPCMGSGHFLVFALPILVAFRMAEDGLSQSAAVDAVLKDNLFGLEIDPRCTQIAAFNLAFAAWRKVGYRALPQLNLACSGLAIGVTKAEWLKLAEKAVTAADPAAKRDLLGVERNLLTIGLEERVKNGLAALYDLFAKAPWLGSLIEPRRAGADIFREGFDKLEPLLASMLTAADTDETREMTVAAQGMAKAAELLGRLFTLVMTNVPYLAGDKQNEAISEYCEAHFPQAKRNLAYCILERSLALLVPEGTVSVVAPQNWLFQPAYPALRKAMLKSTAWNLTVRLGTKAFQTPMWDLNVMLFLTSKSTPLPEGMIRSINLEAARSADEKLQLISSAAILSSNQLKQLNNQGSIIKEQLPDEGELVLGDLVESAQGLVTGDDNKFTRRFWEVSPISREWSWLQLPPREISLYSGRTSIILWEHGAGPLHRDSNAHNFPPPKLLGRPGVAVQRMSLNATLFSGDIFGDHVAPLVPRNDEDLPAIWCFCESAVFSKELRKVDSALKASVSSFLKVPFDVEHWRAVANNNYPNGLPKPRSDDPTQWLFEGSPRRSTSPLQVAATRLLGYVWPRQTGIGFLDCPSGGSNDLEAHSDTDGIVCLTALKGEPPAEQRLNALFTDAFGVDWSAAKLANLLAEVAYPGKSLDDWLHDGFFQQHCELFQHRPFIWHIWDGRRDGFHALVNYHRLAAPNGEGQRTLEKLIYSYLGDWIDRQRADQKAGVEGADARLTYAEHLKAELSRILEGEPPYDIFVRWKPLYEQRLGWDPDITDGVRMNIRPFMTARTLNARGANACILRMSPKIKWDKDRGKERNRDKADYPWFWSCDGAAQDFVGGKDFDGNRWNNLHYSRAVKQAARDQHRAKSGGKT